MEGGALRKIKWRRNVTAKYRDAIFRRMIIVLNDMPVVHAKYMKSSFATKNKLLGFVTENTIYLSPFNRGVQREKPLKIMIHEIGHVIFPHNTEKETIVFENIMWRLLTKEQKDILSGYLPKNLRRI